MKTIATILGFTILISSAQQEKKTSNQAPQKVENAVSRPKIRTG